MQDRRTIVLDGDATVFRAEDGQEIVYLTALPHDGQVLYSPDGQTYYELASKGFGGTAVEHNLSFEDPHQGREGRWHRRYAELVLDGVPFKKVPAPREISVVPLPPVRKPEYLFRLPDGRYLYVSADTYNYSYESFKLFIGNGKTMREIPVRGVERYRDGGTTVLETAEETLVSPSRASSPEQIRGMFDLGAKPAWGNEEIERLDISQFEISESAAGVTIAEKTPEPEVTVQVALRLLGTWHQRRWEDGTITWLKEPTDRDYAAIGERGRSPYVQIWLPNRESIVFHGADADRVLGFIGPFDRTDEISSSDSTD